MNTSDPSRTYAGSTPPAGTSLAMAGCALLTAVGAASLLLEAGGDPARAWRAYLVNFLFFTSLGTGGVLFLCAIHMTSGVWGRDLKRVAEGMGLFLPVSALLFLLMIPGLPHLLPWVEHPYGPAWWLDLNFLVARNFLGLLLLSVLGLAMIRLSLRVDFGVLGERGETPRGLFARMLTRGWKGGAEELPAAGRRLVGLAPVYAVLFTVVLTVLGVDLIMSLTHGWYSTLIGAYYFVGAFYISLAALLAGVIWLRRRYGLRDRILPGHLHDIAKLAMGFGLLVSYFFYVHVFIIWYGNLPEETTMMIARLNGSAWRTLAILTLFFCFAFPLAAMLHEGLKKRSGPMLLFAGMVLATMWAQLFLLVGPPVTGIASVRFGLFEILVTLGFAGLFGLTFLLFIRGVPPVVVQDPVLDRDGEVR